MYYPVCNILIKALLASLSEDLMFSKWIVVDFCDFISYNIVTLVNQ